MTKIAFEKVLTLPGWPKTKDVHAMAVFCFIRRANKTDERTENKKQKLTGYDSGVDSGSS
jgi:hypothetical protein